ncbi:MAG TPA: glutathione S-transferase [Azospirillaceae bacterium]|nr:glutathione S-transferase [Azospirillaceae bacterium]
MTEASLASAAIGTFMPNHTIKLHGTALSGHAHRVELLLRMLDLPYCTVDASAPVRRAPEFRRLNPFAQIPVLEDGDLVLSDSNAMLVYLAKRYDKGGTWLPEEPVAAALVQRWLSIAAGEVKYGPAAARLMTHWGLKGDKQIATEIAENLFRFMDVHLTDRTYLAAEHPTIADLACYSYIAHAPEGGISLAPYPALRAWLSRVEALPHFKPMPRTPMPPST